MNKQNEGRLCHATVVPEELLQYLPVYRVIICMSCKYAIQPKAIARHLKEIHSIKRSDRKPFMQHVEKYKLAEHELVMQYIPHEFPVPLLPIQNGLQCKSERCVYLCVTEKRMKHHWLSVHGRHGLAACDWRTAPLQTFFKGNLLRYFTSTPSNKRVTVQAACQAKSTKELDIRTLFTPIATLSSINFCESDNLMMQHFITQTCFTLATNDDTRKVWRDVVPQIAHQYDFVKHALLACSALHMAYLNPNHHAELTLKARTHQDRAFPLFRTAIPVIEAETSDAVIIFARLVAITSLALDDGLFSPGEKEDSLPSWLFLTRSGCTMLCEVWGRIGTGPVRYLAESWKVFIDTMNPPHQQLLDYLKEIPSGDWPAEVQAAYNTSTLALARTFTSMHAMHEQVNTLDILRYWPVENSVEYVELLKNSHPAALIPLAYYCIVMHRAEMKSWYLNGRAIDILSTVVRKLDPAWHRYIEWPMKEIGLSPNLLQYTQ